MSTIVTGGAGFLGSHLVDSLIRDGRRVVIVDNLSTGSLRNIETAISSGSASFVYLDVATTAASLRESLLPAIGDEALDAIYHLASPASPDAYGNHPWETLAVNGLGTMSLVEFALEHRARFIYSSTSEIYGDPLVHPQPEDYFGNVDPIGPRACYDEGKRFGEAAVSVAVASRGLDGRLVRFFNCYGPRMSAADGRLIAALGEAAFANKPFPIHGTGLQTRSMTYVDDAVRLLRLVAETQFDSLQPINIGSDHERTVLEVAEVFARVAGVPFEVEHLDARPGDPQRRRPDITRARALGYSPATTLEAGLETTIAWLRSSAVEYV